MRHRLYNNRKIIKHTTAENLVFIIPGAIQFTRIPSHASSFEQTLVNPNKAVLLIEYIPRY